MWIFCILSHYLFISVSRLRVTPTLKLNACPKLEPDFWEGLEVVDVFLGPEGKIGSRRGRFHGFGVFEKEKRKKKSIRVGWVFFFFYVRA